MLVVCEECGRTFTQTRSKYNAYAHHYCSLGCVNRVRRRSFLENFDKFNGDRWELVDYEDKHNVVIRCKKCGAIRSVRSCSLVSAPVACGECKDRKKNERERIEEELRSVKARRKELKVIEKRLEKAYSKACQREVYRQRAAERLRRERKLRELRREKRIKNNGKIDKDITLRRLYERDKGRCYLCGRQCDYSDHNVTSEGYFIAGKRYPSIDHVVPLSKGGTHTWDNVKLACIICNTTKRDKDGYSPIGVV